jgi:secondary thiamine-phosphate synthase enzyme
MNMMNMIEIRTGKRVEIVDITDKVVEEVQKSGVQNGIVIVYSLHTTTAIILNEGEKGLLEDLEKMLEKLIPRGARYKHDIIDSNADAHLRATLLGNSIVILVDGGSPVLGTWQRVLFVELDGPRTRRVIVRVIKGD